MRPQIIKGYFILSCLTLLIFPGAVQAQVTITDVVNAANRIGSGLPGYGIAQGALFAVTGYGVGPGQPLQATFPLPSDAGLGGVTVTINVGGSSASAIMVYVSPNELDAILPSNTPLGTGTVTVNNNGTTATSPLTVVASAFGIFSTSPLGGPALAFNMNADGTTTQNSSSQSAQPGQTILLNGTGLGAIAGDETQPGATDVPNVNFTIWIGNVQATVVSAGRGTCCTGLDPTYPFPPGLAAWDVIQFVVPDGVSGCRVSVAVQIGNQVSNLPQLAVAPGGGTCPEIAGLNLGDFVTLPNPFKDGLITMQRIITNVAVGTTATTVTSDSGSAQFFSIDLGRPVQVSDQIYSSFLKLTAGSCSLTLSRFDRSIPIQTTPPPAATPLVTLDAGPVINVVDPDRTQPMPNKNNFYGSTTVTTALTIPGIPPITTGGPGFVESGTWNMNNGAGGADIAGFNVPLVNPQPVTVTGFDQLNSVTRGQDLPLAWTGGDPDGYMQITGSSIAIQGTVSYAGLWNCTVRTADGKFTVPGFVTAGLPQVSQVPSTTGASGIINFTPTSIQLVNIPGVDLATFISTWSIGKAVAYP